MKNTILALAILFAVSAQAQVKTSEKPPRLVVGIMVDQMRHEFLFRFQPKYGNGGFKRLMNDGFMLKNGHYNYTPTVTGPGHASVYAGTTPSIHGIIGNEWYDKELKKSVNCVEDPAYQVIGVESGNGDVDPGHLNPSQLTDPVDQMLADLLGDLADRGRIGDGDREVDRGGPARNSTSTLGRAERSVCEPMPRNPPLLPPALATSLAAWLAIFSITLWSIINRPRPGAAARRGMASTVDATGSAPFGGPADQQPQVELALKHPTDHQPGHRKQQNDHERDKTSEDGHDAERDPNDHGELGCGHNSRCSFAEECWRSRDARPTIGLAVPTWRPGAPSIRRPRRLRRGLLSPAPGRRCRWHLCRTPRGGARR